MNAVPVSAVPASQPAQNRLAVLGSPIAHSQSPAIHAAAYTALGLDWGYDRVELTEPELAGFLAARGSEWRGFSLTMPLKTEAFALADELDDAARATGAVNTLLLTQSQGGRRLLGFNTDVAGIVNSLAEHGVQQAGSVTILGGGATAGSAILAAAELGAHSVTVAVRTPAKAAGLQRQADAVGVALRIVPLEGAVAAASASDLLLSTLPGGSDTGLVFEPGVIGALPLYDVAYAPWPSALGAQWQAAGGQLMSGLGMLLHQALVQVRIFVSGDPHAPLPDEAGVFRAMVAAVEG
ncbi:shikimate dehydrogenase [Microterricola viridarii]|uniref:Shikimate dehydrogenase n=1 Tax=Microterricola viridarii TaxID=412690 RepID=A0A1H1U072_9MICO|nr:shikimate dehydrogenase [Microterricola viridarii]